MRRSEFPILQNLMNGQQLAYLDNAATTQKPQCVIDAISNFYLHTNANIHRGVHTLSQNATLAFENARKTVARFLGASSEREIIFTSGTTGAINLLAAALGQAYLKPGDEILLTQMEHHSNIVPWQLAAGRTGTIIRVLPMDEIGELRLDLLDRFLTQRTKIFAMTHVSNALGTINPITDLTAAAKKVGALTLIDGAQAVPHLAVNVQDLGCDFYAFSGHKAYGPTGIGALWGRRELLKNLPPYQGGGDMIETVTFEQSTFADVPSRFEAGTPHIAGVVGLDAALRFINETGLSAISAHESTLTQALVSSLQSINGLRLIGTPKSRASVVSFVLEGIHPHDAGTFLDQQGVAVRTGHHCAQPVMDFFKIPASIRASIGLYNSQADIDQLCSAIHKCRGFFL